jgi:hypothetical protein
VKALVSLAILTEAQMDQVVGGREAAEITIIFPPPLYPPGS